MSADANIDAEAEDLEDEGSEASVEDLNNGDNDVNVLMELYAKRDALTGSENKRARQKISKKIKVIESRMADTDAKTATEAAEDSKEDVAEAQSVPESEELPDTVEEATDEGTSAAVETEVESEAGAANPVDDINLLMELHAQRDALTGPENKRARQKINKKIKAIEARM